MRPPLPPLSRLAIAALRVPLPETGAGGLALDGPASVPTQAKRDADGLAVDARTFLADARAVMASVEREVVFEPELAEEARTLLERGAHLATNALAVEEGDRSALQAAVDDLRAALARLEALPRRVGLDAVGEVWDVLAERWERMYGLLRAFREREGHARVPRKHVEEGEKLGIWLSTQRTRHQARGLSEAERKAKSASAMSDDEVRRLEALGVVWRLR